MIAPAATIAGGLIGGPMGAQIGGMLGGALGGYGAAGEAGEATRGGIQEGIDARYDMFREGQEATAPWREAGAGAVGSLQDIYGTGEGQDPYQSFFGMQDKLREGFQTSPGQEYQLAEAEKAAQRQLSSRGLSGSGAEMKELQRIAQGQASQEFGSYMNQFGNYTDALRAMSESGRGSAGQTAQLATGVGAGVAPSYASLGAAEAQEQITKSNIMGNVVEQGLDLYGEYKGQNVERDAAAANLSDYASSRNYATPPSAYGMRPPSQMPIAAIA